MAYHVFLLKLMLAIMFFYTLSASRVHAEIYQWIDEDGNTQYGDRPQNGAAHEKVELEESNRFNSSVNKEHKALKTLFEESEAAGKRLDSLKDKEKAKKEAEEQSRLDRLNNCYHAHRQMVVLELERPIKFDGTQHFFPSWILIYDDADLVYVDDKDRPNMVDEYTNRIDQYCVSQDISDDAKDHALVYWVVHKKCAKAFLQDPKMEEYMNEHIKSWLVNRKTKKTNDLKLEIESAEIIDELYAEVEEFCGKDYKR